ncbi:hypothetical protein FRB94_008660 [Tulasnella sp. JGI-2019a]|nr:hypothetical protein FRB93_012243 [Tulasnella sp. JGI-2019a]KAG9011376.1 hypothetical protein FRB94_008660 [Tulasnella sp. JGI-2019a]KAG9035490.1 hypothetical protein FRB95_011196 [Tulasnella sp. JGI-2019a]
MPKLKSSRVRFDNEECESDRPLKKARTTRLSSPPPKRSRSHRLGVLPSGNLLLAADQHTANIRPSGLGMFNIFPDAALLLLLSTFDATNLYALASTSRAFFAYATHDPLWKDLYILKAGGILTSWEGSWRYTYLRRFGALQELPEKPTEDIKTPGLYSDELFQPALCAKTSLRPYFFLHPTRSRSTIAKHSRNGLDFSTFTDSYARASKPVLITKALDAWKAYSENLWSMEALEGRFDEVMFRAEALDCPFRVYSQYSQDCDDEDSPLYLFDSRFVEKTGGTMGAEYTPPDIFGRDLFELLGPERPDYRWLIVGPARSGSTFHKDPNGTSAWNAVLSGSKGWILFPPDTPPPGVYTNDDESEVTSPLSIAEWFLTYFDVAWENYGPHATNSETGGRMVMGVCGPGEVMYVPSGWWHLVVNLEESVAVTQNFVSESELSNVLRFMRDKPDQMSGFKGSLAPEEIRSRFSDALQSAGLDAFKRANTELQDKSKTTTRKESVWDSVVSKDIAGLSSQDAVQPGVFTFGFSIDEEEEEQF